MKYFGSLFLNELPYVIEERRVVLGKEQHCIVIPTDTCQLKRGKNGRWLFNFRALDSVYEERMISHDLSLVYRTNEDAAEAKRMGLHRARIGVLHPMSEDDSKKLDLTNNMTPIFCTGDIFIDEICKEDIRTDPRTGKRYLRFSFRKTQLLDAYGNSHEIVVTTRDGEHQIGLAKEIAEGTKQNARVGKIVERENPAPASAASPEVGQTMNIRPAEIDGYVF